MGNEKKIRPPSLREDNREHARQRMLEAAQQLFTTEGYERTTMDAISQRAGVGRATLFKYFPHKTALILPLAQQILGNQLHPQLEQLLQSSLTTYEVLRAVFHILETEILNVPYLAQTFVTAFSIQTAQTSDSNSGFTLLIEHIIGKGQQRGEIRHDLSAKVLANYIATLHTTIFVYVVTQNRIEAYMPDINTMLAFVENGLRK